MDYGIFDELDRLGRELHRETKTSIIDDLDEIDRIIREEEIVDWKDLLKTSGALAGIVTFLEQAYPGVGSGGVRMGHAASIIHHLASVANAQPTLNDVVTLIHDTVTDMQKEGKLGGAGPNTQATPAPVSNVPSAGDAISEPAGMFARRGKSKEN